MRRARLKIGLTLLGTALAVLTASAPAEVVQSGNLRVSFEGGLAPHSLPRNARVPVAVTLSGHVITTDRAAPPQLRTISLAINRNGKLNHLGLPSCRYHQIQPASTREAIQACRDSIVGTGEFRANVVLPEQSPFPSSGRVIAFNGLLHGRRVVFAHIYGTEPLPQSRVLAFEVGRTKGAYRTTLTAELPRVAADWGYVSSVGLTLDRKFQYRGRSRSYISAGCPAPGGSTVATFRLARASFGFEDGRVLTSTLFRSCKVRTP